MTNEQASEVADLSKTINDYVDEMMARFVIGDADLDKDWDSYVKQLEAMNVARYLKSTRKLTMEEANKGGIFNEGWCEHLQLAAGYPCRRDDGAGCGGLDRGERRTAHGDRALRIYAGGQSRACRCGA